jgi:hypothetical protein
VAWRRVGAGGRGPPHGGLLPPAGAQCPLIPSAAGTVPGPRGWIPWGPGSWPRGRLGVGGVCGFSEGRCWVVVAGMVCGFLGAWWVLAGRGAGREVGCGCDPEGVARCPPHPWWAPGQLADVPGWNPARTASPCRDAGPGRCPRFARACTRVCVVRFPRGWALPVTLSAQGCWREPGSHWGGTRMAL